MKLSLSNYSVNQYLDHGETPRSTLQALRSCGFTCTDLDLLPSYLEGDVNANADRMKQLLAETDLTATMAHAPSAHPFTQPDAAVKWMARALHFCRRVGIPQVVIHPAAQNGNTREEFFAKNTAFFRSLLPYAEETGVCILIENIGNYADPYFLWNGKDLRELVDRVDHPLAAACWDIGHANHFYERDCEQYSSILALGDKLAAIHAHDNCGYMADTYKHIRLDMHTLPCYASPASVNWDAVLQGLKDIGYKGTFNFEVKSPAASERSDFVYNGQVVNTLQMMPLRVWQLVNTALYEMGRFMLESYGMYEG